MPKPNSCCISWSKRQKASAQICFKQGVLSNLRDKPLKLVDQFTYLGSNISSTESDVNIDKEKEWIAIDRLSIKWKSGLAEKRKRDFLQVLLYGCTTRNLTKCMEKRLHGNYTRILPAGLKKSWKKHLTKQQSYSYLPLISQTMLVGWTKHAKHS